MAEILSVATRLADHCVTAAETKAFLSASFPPDTAARFARLIDTSRNQKRYSVLPLEQLLRLSTLHGRSEQYAQHAVELGEAVAREALLNAHVDGNSVDVVISVSATGYMMPSLDTHLINRLRLNPTCRRIPFMQLGCAGGVASLSVAAELLRGTSARHALVVSVELPSLSLQIAEPSPADVISSIQFGDGAAAAVLSGQPQGSGWEVIATRTVLLADTVERDGVRLTETGLRLMPQHGLPSLLRRHLPEVMQNFLQLHQLQLEDISFWVVHPRGPQILDAVAQALHLPERALEPSWAVWERCGNTVSSSVFFILRHLQDHAAPPPGALGMMLAFGAGVSCEMVLLRASGQSVNTY